MAVMSRGMRSLMALTERTMNCNKIYTRLLFRRYTTSTSLAAPPSSEKYVAAQLVLRGSDNSPATEIKAVPNVLLPRVVIYDGVCHLSHTGVKWLIKADIDKKIKFCCLQSKTAEPYIEICGLEREDVLQRLLFVEGPGVYHHGSAACLRTLSYLPQPYSAMSTLMIIPSPWRDALYDYVAKHRYDWFGKDDDCIVMKETELLERFVDRDELLERFRLQQE